ncbi:hypothetical protein [Streptomyces hygroscopicus]|uniref:hypothetical protein n=1 Tax=Streptomyces hygroscopicus TaxID=1912 RepID=UPI003F4CDD02
MDATLAQGAYVVQECFGCSGAVGADEQVGAVAVGVGELGQGRVQDGDVVGGGVGSGVAGPEQPGQGFAGVVQDQAGQLAPPAREAGVPARVSGGLEPCDFPGGGAGRAQCRQCDGVDAGQ